jgi:uncharacterized protein
MKAIIEAIRKSAQTHFRGARPSHGFDHTERVLALALHVGKKEGADLTVLTLAALLHDIGRRAEDASQGELCHAEVGSEMARKILRKHRLPDDVIDKVVHCIRHHRYRRGSTPATIEARVLFDADKLDAIGAIGIGRAFLFAGENGARLHNTPGIDPLATRAYSSEDTAYREFLAKLRHVHERMLTREGKRLAEKRHAFMERFFDQMQEEIEGER